MNPAAGGSFLFLVFQCTLQLASCAIENPLSSLYVHFDCISSMLTACSAKRVVCHAGALGASSIKALEIYTTLPEKLAVRFFGYTKAQAYKRFETAEVVQVRLAKKSGK